MTNKNPTVSHSSAVELKEDSAANREFMQRRAKYLNLNQSVTEALHKRGLLSGTINRYKLGLSDSYEDSRGVSHAHALLAPILNENGIFINQTVYLNLPGITINPLTDTCWKKGAAKTYYSGSYTSQSFVIVCDSLFDLWLTRQNIGKFSDNKLEYLLICSTNERAFPEEWHFPKFWRRFKKVFVANANDASGNEQSLKIRGFIGTESFRLIPPESCGSTWSDFWLSEASDTQFKRLLNESFVLGEKISSDSENTGTVGGRFAFQPVNIVSSFHHGHLYYLVNTRVSEPERTRDAQGNTVTRMTSKIETVVVRSDRTIHTVVEEPAPRGTPPSQRILRLSDGTMIESRPNASAFATWEWDSINLYKEGDANTRSLFEILLQINEIIRRAVWLPSDYDYDLLSLLVPVTYCQAIFQAVPMIMVVGPSGSGKSSLGQIMASLCANSVIVGQTTVAAATRQMDEANGLIILDDLETIGTKGSRKSSKFSEFEQALKVSYKKDTSWRQITDVKRDMSPKRLNLFGVKIINNTTGADSILGSRMLRVHTQSMPSELQELMETSVSFDKTVIKNLRNELHTWIFENVALIAEAYQRLLPTINDRNSEIAAPLRVIAELNRNDKVSANLETALRSKAKVVFSLKNPVELFKLAIENLVCEGFRQLSATHILLEMNSLIATSPDLYQLSDDKWRNTAWIGRQLRNHGFVEKDISGRRVFHYGKFLRVFPLQEDFVNLVLLQQKLKVSINNKAPFDFCQRCETCRYKAVNCPFMPTKLKRS